MEKQKLHQTFSVIRSEIYLGVIFIMSCIVFFLDWRIALPCFAVFAVLVVYYFRVRQDKYNQMSKLVEDLSVNLSDATRGTMRRFPMPLVVLHLDGQIVWYNKIFKELFKNHKLFDKTITQLIPEVDPTDFIEKRKDFNFNLKEIKIGDKVYDLLGSIVKSEDSNDYLVIIYFLDKTEQVALKTAYENERTAFAMIVFDNYDDLMQNVDHAYGIQLESSVENKLDTWLKPCGGYLRKFARDRYVYIFESKYVNWMIEKKFDILDQVREIDTGSDLQATISIGIGVNGENLSENLEFTKNAIDLAIGRGGDQVVVKLDEEYSFFGGRSKEFERRTKIKSRTIAGVLKNLYKQCDNILIMGHQNADLDSIGAAIGMYRMAKVCGKIANIVVEREDGNVKQLIDSFEQVEEYHGLFLDNDEAKAICGENTLLIVVDVHRPSLTQCEELLEMCKNIVVIDHHRRGAEYIQNPTLMYQEPYASSTCELVTEILQYTEEKIRIPKAEAEALYAGIVLDTKNFTFKTGVRTFEAAAFLRRNNIDTVLVRQYFQNDFEKYKLLSKVVSTANVTKEGVAVARCVEDVENAQVIAASAADQLLSLSGITAAFVLSKNDEDILFISGRSLGELNVQLVLEKMGGGGHLTIAGAQLENMDYDEGERILFECINEVLYENTTDKEG